MTHPQHLLDIAHQHHRDLVRQAEGHRVRRLQRRRRRPVSADATDSLRSARRARE